ncbi:MULTISPECIES: acyltransferase family protein [unclassified Erwinia]|uniref:acyltransferase family protein n=1 Tax=unclassified Erwinia TaxID=2622719 RepID=UPI000C17C4D7|nr:MULTISPECIES: acyltransferase [unclassified Erwinia]PIJ48817.1 acyltransferase [Erwinia sp. OAMSP11]PIJ82951.1 acyltransferase [Erwinia sp. OLMDSP33]
MKNKLESIQILRGLAALSVVIFHYRFFLPPGSAARSILDKSFWWGGVGVDLFFVISGFIMVYVTENKPSGAKTSMSFLSNRLTRILPTYYVVLLFVFLTSGAMSIFHHPEKSSNLVSAMTFQPYVATPAPLYIPDSGMYNVRWTLNYELYFYFIFSLCLLIKHRFTAICVLFSLPTIYAYFSTGSVTLSTAGYSFDSASLRFLTNPIIFEFGIGILSGVLYFRFKNKSILKNPYILLSCVIVTIGGISSGFLIQYNLITSIMFSFLVLLFSLQNDSILKFTPKIFITLGNISFSLYLIHNPLGGYILGLAEKVQHGALKSLIGIAVILFITLITSWLSHKYIEIKLTKKVRDLLKSIAFNK